MNCMEYSEISVNTMTCCRVSTAVTICEPEPMVKSPAVFSGVGNQSAAFSWSLKRISNGS